MKLFPVSQAKWLAIVGGILFFALVFVVGLVLHGGLDFLLLGDWRLSLNLFLLFAVLGAYYGTIAILDGRSEMGYENRPVLRTILCGALAGTGVILVQAWHLPGPDLLWPSIGFLIGAFLGWLGWTWAKYVDF